MPRRKPVLVSIESIGDKPSVKAEVKKSKAKIYKQCISCETRLPIDVFYTNKGEKNGLRRDRWCKDCIKRRAHDEASFREYMFENNRLWSAELWDDAMKQAEIDVNAAREYAEVKDEDVRRGYIEARACVVACSKMNNAKYYNYVNHSDMPEDFDINDNIAQEKAAQRDSEDPYYSLAVYSKSWQGRYTQSEIDRMNAYYESIIKTRGIEDSIGENYARQFVKQSAMVDSLAEKMRSDPSKELTSQYKESVAALEVLSQAAQLAPRYRKADSSMGLGSLAEFIRAMEYGELLTNEPDFPPDQIDGMIENTKHIVAAMQGAGGLWDSVGNDK